MTWRLKQAHGANGAILHDRATTIAELNAVQKEKLALETEVSRLKQELSIAKAKANAVPKEVQVPVPTTTADNPAEVRAAMIALEAEVLLREKAEAELASVREAVLQHTQTLKKAAEDDEEMRSDMTMELQYLRDEVMSRESVILRLREEMVRLELQHRSQPPQSHHIDQTVARLQEELMSRDSVIERLREELVRLELGRLRTMPHATGAAVAGTSAGAPMPWDQRRAY